MKIFFTLAFTTLYCTYPAWAEKQVIPTAPCSVNISILDPAIKEKIRFWGRVLEVKETDAPPRGQEIIFEPKTTRAGPKLKRVKILMKRSHCWLEVKKDQYWNVVLDEKGTGTIFAVRLETEEKIKKSKKYPIFEPEMNDCGRSDHSFDPASADLHAIAKVIKIVEDEKEGVRIIDAETIKIINGPQLEKLSIIQKIGYCDTRLSMGVPYKFILNSANAQFYYHDCCGRVSTHYTQDKDTGSGSGDLKKSQ